MRCNAFAKNAKVPKGFGLVLFFVPSCSLKFFWSKGEGDSFHYLF